MNYSIAADDLPRVMQCGGFLAMEKLDSMARNTEAAIEGNAAHSVIVSYYRNEVQDISEWIGKTINGNFIVSDEMIDHLQRVIDYLDRRNIQIQTEVKTDYTVALDCNYGIVGRADYMSFDGKTLYIDDLKFGHRIVEPETNWTLISHAIGSCVRYGYVPKRIKLTIIQPRPYHPDGEIRSVIITADELREYREVIRVHLTNLPNVVTTGPMCHNCAAVGLCPAARRAALASVEISTNVYSENIPNSAIGVELELLERAKHAIEDRYKAIAELAKINLKRGEIIPGYDVEMSYGHRKWSLDIAVIEMMIGQKITAPKAKTPAAIIREGVSEVLVNSLTTRPPTGVRLIRRDVNKRAKKLLERKD